MKTGHRIRLYIFGFLMGCALVYFILFRGQDRSYWFPENRVKEQINKSTFIFSDHAKCILQCKRITEEEVRDILKNGKVNFSESDTHGAPCPSYALEGITSGNKKIQVLITVFERNSIAEITTAINMEAEKDTCKCN